MGAAAIFRLTTPFTSAELDDIGYEQAADVVYFTHLNHPVQKLSRYAHDVWTMNDVVWGTTTATPTGVTVTAHRVHTPSGWTPVSHYYAVTAVDAVTGRESLVSDVAMSDQTNDLTVADNYNTVGWSAVTGAEFYRVYKQVNGVLGYIGTSEVLTLDDQNITPDFSDTPPKDKDPFGSADNYPARVTFFEQRAVFARTALKPNGLFGSRSSDFESMNVSRPTKQDDAYAFGLAARQVNTIRHLVPQKALLVLTDAAAFSVSGPDGAITPTSVKVSPESYRGCSNVRPVAIDDVTFMLTAKGNSLRTLGFSFERDGYKGNDLSVFARHLFKHRSVVDMAWTEHPTATLWLVRDDGKLACLTWQPEQQVWGWTLCETDGLVERVCSITEGLRDVLYAVIRREINGVQKRYTERLTTTEWDDIAHAVYMDAARTYDGDPITDFSAPWLAGKALAILADGAVVEGVTADVDGLFSLPSAASVVTVGLAYEAWMQTLGPVLQFQGQGSTKGRKQTFAKVVISVQETRGIEVGGGQYRTTGVAPTASEAAGGRLIEVKTRSVEPYGSPPALVTGELEVPIPPGDWREATVVIRQRYPLPMTILGVFPDIVTGS